MIGFVLKFLKCHKIYLFGSFTEYNVLKIHQCYWKYMKILLLCSIPFYNSYHIIYPIFNEWYLDY